MKKKNLFVILAVMCIGLFIPINASALQVYNNVNIDYRFFVDEDESNAGALNFKLYDKSGALNFNSQYDSSTKQYYFQYDENGFYKEEYYNYYHELRYNWRPYDDVNEEYDYRPYVPYLNESGYLINHNNMISHQNNDWFDTRDSYTYIPMILEETTTHYKRIIFSSITIRSNGFVFIHVNLINNTTIFKEEPISLGDSFLENVNFMRRTMLDYSGELWEELNSEPIASSEIYSDMISSGKYENKSLSSGNYNVPEETLEDYANSLPVFSFKKADENKKEEKNIIVDVITNPKTWNNGVTLLIVSMFVIVGSSIVIIKKKV